MTILCRNNELSILDRIFSSKKPEFLALYGRRRVGKTYLIRHFFSQKNCLFFNVTGSKNGSYSDQLAHFMKRIGEVFLNGITPNSPKNWDEAFQLLTDIILSNTQKNKKIVIFIDELPWMATRKSKLLEIIDYFWNQYWSQDNRIKLIVCGSSASWIMNKIIHNKGGLYNRVTETMHLQPFNLRDTEIFLNKSKVKLNRKQLTELYMVTGGIPFYLSKAEPGLSATQLTEKLAFNTKSLLLGEFDALFESLFDNGDAYVEMIRTIAKNREGISQQDLFKQLTKTPKGETSLKRLKDLEDSGFVIKFTPSFNFQRGAYCRIEDEYTLFYLQWIDPIKGNKLQSTFSPGYWKTLKQTPKWFSWAGYAFEAICYKHINEIRKGLQLSPAAMPSSWRYKPSAKSIKKGAQIDLLFDREDGCITLCEIKFTLKPFEITKDYAEKLKSKIQVFKEITGTKKQIFLAFISANGIKENKYSEELVNQVVTLDQLFDDDDGLDA